jgi:GTP pyrophosphokinase
MLQSASAEDYARTAHYYQHRKYGGGPYITHPEMVAKLAKSFGLIDYVVQAAWLHDVVEDTIITLDDLRSAGFHNRVVKIVSEVTSPSKQPKYRHQNRAERKKIDNEYLSKASFAGRTLKLLDCYHNLSDMLYINDGFKYVFAEETKTLLKAIVSPLNPLHQTLYVAISTLIRTILCQQYSINEMGIDKWEWQ